MLIFPPVILILNLISFKGLPLAVILSKFTSVFFIYTLIIGLLTAVIVNVFEHLSGLVVEPVNFPSIFSLSGLLIVVNFHFLLELSQS